MPVPRLTRIAAVLSLPAVPAAAALLYGATHFPAPPGAPWVPPALAVAAGAALLALLALARAGFRWRAEGARLRADDAHLFQQVEQAKREWESIVDALREGVALVAPDGSVRRANVALASLGMSAPRSAIDRHHHELLPLFGEDPRGCAICHTLRTGERADRVLELPSGSTYRTTVAPHPSGGAVVVVADVSAERRAEAQVHAAHQRVFEVEKLAAIGRLAAGVSHEVNNPLTGILAVATLLVEDERLDADTRSMLQMIQREARRAAEVTRDLLRMTRPEAETTERVSMNEIAGEAERLRAVTAQEAGIATTLELDEALPEILGDRAQLLQVVVNLLTNAEEAVAHAPERRITLATARVPGGIELRVEDTGAGIPSAHLPRVFEPFFTTKPLGQGTGLGLALAYAVIERHGGVIRAENRPEGGARFTVFLPPDHGVSGADPGNVLLTGPRTTSSGSPSGEERGRSATGQAA